MITRTITTTHNSVSASPSTRRLALLLMLILMSFAACAVGGGNDDDENADITDPGTGAVFSLGGVTNERGIATVSFAIAEGTTKFGITAGSEDDEVFVRFTDILSGDGTDYLNPGREEISFADSFSRFVKAASIPSRDVDPPVNSGERFTVSAEAVDADGQSIVGEELTFMVTSKADPGLEAGRMRVNLYYVGDVGQEQGTRDVIRSALEEFRRIFQGSAAITLDVQEIDVDGPVVLPLPVDGNEFYARASAQGVSPSVNVFVSGDVDAGGGNVLGIAADIPGPYHPSARSAVVASFFTGAGPDGIYSSEEVRILGETFAHETAHFMGVFHPVDFSGSTVAATDPLADTPTCSFITECVSNNDLIQNLMFTSPVADGEGGFVPQNRLTSQQRSVLNRYIVVD